MAVDAANIKFYQCATWAEGDTHGGDIDLNNQIVSGTDQNVFDDVTNEERAAGDSEYRKIFIRNENADTWLAVKAWISAFTPADNDEVSIVKGGFKDTQINVALSGTLTFTNGDTAVTGDTTAFTTEVGKGDFIQLDADGLMVEVASVTDDTHLTLVDAYSGAGGSGSGTRQGGSLKTFVQPTSKTDANALDLGDLAQNEYAAVWIKRVVTAGGSGYTNNSFELAFEDS